MKNKQRGGFVIGLIVGLLVGLALALGVALYVTKVPIPFVDKVPGRTAEQDAAEAERNKNWDPNAPLYGKNPAKPRPVPQAASGEVQDDPASAVDAASAPASATVAQPASTRDPASILAGETPSSAPTADAFIYFVQAGAFGQLQEAEQQRAKLTMMGLEARISEREQSGRTMYRVRVGPFEQRTAAEETKTKLGSAGVESVLVRLQR